MLAMQISLLTFATAAGGESQELPVFVLAGQSNMAGGGQPPELPTEFKTSNMDVLFVQFWDMEFKPLDLKVSKSFGPEVTFGAEMVKAFKRPIGMVKMAYGGTSLEEHWNPASEDKRGLYKRLTGYVVGIKAKQNVKVAGMIWMQGEADAKYHSKTVAQYRDKLEALIDGCRREFGNDVMPFVCGRMNASGPFEKQVREAQETVQRNHYAWIDCDDLEKNADKLHYNTNGQLELGRRFAAATLKLMGTAAQGVVNK